MLMKIRLKRPFTYQLDARTTRTLEPGEHDVTDHVAELAMRFGGAKLVLKKKAPQNKARGKAPKDKAGVGRTAKRRGRPRSKPDA